MHSSRILTARLLIVSRKGVVYLDADPQETDPLEADPQEPDPPPKETYPPPRRQTHHKETDPPQGDRPTPKETDIKSIKPIIEDISVSPAKSWPSRILVVT